MNRYEGILLDVAGTLLNGEPSDEMILKTNMAKLGIHDTAGLTRYAISSGTIENNG